MSGLGAGYRVLSLVAVGLLVSIGAYRAQAPPADGQDTGTRLSQPMPELCASCHGEVSDWQGHASTHVPVAEGRCTDCHNAHASRHPGLLAREGARLCLSCHTDTRDILAAGGVHQAIGDEGCEGCHDPHASDVGGLLTATTPGLCTSCHQNLDEVTSRAFQHSPYADGACGDCHSPHASTVGALLHDETGAVCTTCHDTSDPAATAQHLGEAVDGNCTSCHDPHGSSHQGLLQEVLHMPFEDGDCSMCHEDGGTTALNAPASEPCLTCHSQYDSGADSTGHHPGAIGGSEADCTSCHSPHAGTTHALLRQGTRRTCEACHADVVETFTEERFSHTLDLEGAGCTGCHATHQGESPGLLANGGGMDTCNACHQDHAIFSHPMGEGVADPSRPGRDMDCISCHANHGSRWDGFLVADANRDLCLRCHPEDDPHFAPGAPE